jgi:hypothetical protein
LTTIKDTGTMKRAAIRVRVYMLIGFFLSLFLFSVGVQHNPQGEFIDLDSHQLQLRYTALFFFLNMVTILALPLLVEFLLLLWAWRTRQSTAHIAVSGYRWCSWISFEGLYASLLIGSVATYALWQHRYIDTTVIEAAFLAYSVFFLRIAAFFFVLISIVNAALQLLGIFCKLALSR